MQWAVWRWARLGEQRLPEALRLSGPDEVARLLGHEVAWVRAVRRRSELTASLATSLTHARPLPATPRVYEALADAPDDEHARLQALLAWLAAHPASGMLLRQLPIEGVHTKWIEQRRALVLDLVAWLRGDAVPTDAARDLPALLGLARPPARLRVRLLCPRLQARVGGLDDLEAPLAQVAALPIAPQAVLVVENLDTGSRCPPGPAWRW